MYETDPCSWMDWLWDKCIEGNIVILLLCSELEYVYEGIEDVTRECSRFNNTQEVAEFVIGLKICMEK